MKLCIEGDIYFIPKFHILETETVKLSIETGLNFARRSFFPRQLLICLGGRTGRPRASSDVHVHTGDHARPNQTDRKPGGSGTPMHCCCKLVWTATPAGRTAGRDMPAGHLPAGARRVLKAAHVIHSSALGACAELVGRLARPLADLPPRAPAGGARRDKSRGVE
jgi:hypothetical protein